MFEESVKYYGIIINGTLSIFDKDAQFEIRQALKNNYNVMIYHSDNNYLVNPSIKSVKLIEGDNIDKVIKTYNLINVDIPLDDIVNKTKRYANNISIIKKSLDRLPEWPETEKIKADLSSIIASQIESAVENYKEYLNYIVDMI